MQSKHSPELKERLANVEAAMIRAGQNARKLAEQTGTKLISVENVSAEATGTHGAATLVENNLKTV